MIRSRVEHLFADQKSQTGLFIRTTGITQALMRIGLANIVYNMRRLLFLERLNASLWSYSRGDSPRLLKMKIKSYPRHQKSNRQKPENTSQTHQSTVIRSFPVRRTGTEKPQLSPVGYV
ncbi:hypothetical protein [Gluconobacter potus]|uniref:hypothetical protein n=1 Tax=Gluconobacter potus TaxID=2724927 RepID=UPI000786319F